MTPKFQTFKNFFIFFESYMSKLQNDILHLSLSLLEMETQLIVYNSRIRLNWVQNCQNPKSHTSSAFLEIFIKYNFMVVKKVVKSYFTSLWIKKCHFAIEHKIFCLFTKITVRNLKILIFWSLSYSRMSKIGD